MVKLKFIGLYLSIKTKSLEKSFIIIKAVSTTKVEFLQKVIDTFNLQVFDEFCIKI